MADEVKVRGVDDESYVRPHECRTHCDDIPGAWHGELEAELNTAGGHVKYGIGKEEDEFCSQEDVVAWVEARRDDDKLAAFPPEADCIAEGEVGDGSKGFTISEWGKVSQEDSPWEVTYEAESEDKDGHEVWKEKYAKAYGKDVDGEIEKAWPKSLAQDADEHEKVQSEWAAKELAEEGGEAEEE
jgi:hypothetical protein